MALFEQVHQTVETDMSDSDSYVYDEDSDGDYVYEGEEDVATGGFPLEAPALLRQNSADVGTSGDALAAMDKVRACEVTTADCFTHLLFL